MCNVLSNLEQLIHKCKCFFYRIAIGLATIWSQWACLDPSDTEYDNSNKRTQRVRYKSCTNPSEYNGLAYCGSNTDIREIETTSNADHPLCFGGSWICSKLPGDTEGTLGDGTTQGTCPSNYTCFTSPLDANGCRGIHWLSIENCLV